MPGARVYIAVKALSPGINDPTTAETCIGYLRAALEQLSGRAIPPEVRTCPRGQVVAARRRSFEEYVDGAYAEIGRYAADNARVVVSVIESLEAVARSALAADAYDRTPLVEEFSRAVARPAIEQARTERDRRLIRDALDRVEDVCAGRSGGILPA